MTFREERQKKTKKMPKIFWDFLSLKRCLRQKRKHEQIDEKEPNPKYCGIVKRMNLNKLLKPELNAENCGGITNYSGIITRVELSKFAESKKYEKLKSE